MDNYPRCSGVIGFAYFLRLKERVHSSMQVQEGVPCLAQSFANAAGIARMMKKFKVKYPELFYNKTNFFNAFKVFLSKIKANVVISFF